MSLNAKKPEGSVNYDPVPQGLHLAICYSVIDLGTQKSEYNGKVLERNRILITWELPDERIDIEKEDGTQLNLPRAISAEYTLSLHDKASLRHDLETWRSRPFTDEELEGFYLDKLLGVPAQIQVMHKPSKDGTRTYANVTSIVQAPKGYKPQVENIPVSYDIERDKLHIPESVPEWIVNKIKESKEWKEMTTDTSQPEQVQREETKPEDDMPF
jgi:hypothetical protein